MNKGASVLVASTGVLAIAGCTTITNFPTQAEFSVGEVANRIQCQLRNVVHDIDSRIEGFKMGWSAGIKLDLSVKRVVSGSLKPFEWVIPTAAGTSMKLGGAGVSGSETADRTIKTEYKFPLASLDALVCPPMQPNHPSDDGAAPEGLFQTVSDYMPYLYDTRYLADPKPELVYVITFTVDHSADLGPTFGIVNFTGGSAIGKKRTDTHTMTVTFNRNPAPVKSGQAVPETTSKAIQRNLDREEAERVLRSLVAPPAN